MRLLHGCSLTNHERKLWITSVLVSILAYALKPLIRKKLTTHFLVLPLIGLRLPGICHRFAVDRASHVCHRPCFPVFRDQSLMDDFSIAIWNKNRVVVAISLGVWMTNIAFLIQGESGHLSLNLSVCQESHTNAFEFRYRPGK